MIYKDGDIVTTRDGEQHRVLYATKRDTDGQHLTLKVRALNKKHRKSYTVETNRIVNVEIVK